MSAILILLIFAVFAVLMFTRKVPALIAVPTMAILIAAAVGTSFSAILNDVISAGSVKLAAAYVAVFAGAMLGRVMMQTGIAEGIIKRAAEFGGDRPMVEREIAAHRFQRAGRRTGRSLVRGRGECG